MKPALAFGVIFLLALSAACSSAAVRRDIDNLEQDLSRLSLPRSSFFEYTSDTIENPPSTTKIEAAFARVYEKCIEPLAPRLVAESATLKERFRDASYEERLRVATRFVDGWGRQVAQCGEPEGLHVDQLLELEDGSTIALSDWVHEFDYVRSRLISAYQQLYRDEEREQRLRNAIFVGIASGMAVIGTPTNSRLIVVKPYIRTDGTIVPAHFRTRPNEYCIDNLSGCK